MSGGREELNITFDKQVQIGFVFFDGRVACQVRDIVYDFCARILCWRKDDFNILFSFCANATTVLHYLE